MTAARVAPEPDGSPEPAELVVERGRLVAYRLFDLGDELYVEPALERLRSRGGVEVLRGGARGLRGEQPVDVRPVAPHEDPRLAGLAVSARLFAQGMALVRFEEELSPGTGLRELALRAKERSDARALTEAARGWIDELLPALGDALVPGAGPPWRGHETYTVVFVEAFAGRPSAGEVLGRGQALAKLLSGEVGERPLSPGEVAEVLAHAHSYFADDLVVVGWEGSLVVEPGGQREVLDVLEFACAVLTGLRAYDAQLEAELDGLFRLVQRRPGASSLLWNPFSRLSHQVHRRWLELTEFTERWENAIKVVDDDYFARVYRVALRRLGVPAWRAAVERKQARIAQVHAFLKEGIDTARAVALETTIVLLILLEILLFLGR